MVIAGFIVYALMAEAIRQLAAQPELLARCAREVAEHAGSGPLTMSTLAKLRTSTNVILEAKRFAPLVPLAFGRAQRTFTCGGFEVPNGWTVYLALSLNNKDRTIFTEPERFDPDRFAPDRAEHRRHPLAFIPQGAEPPTGHRCLGLDYSTFLSVVFLASLCAVRMATAAAEPGIRLEEGATGARDGLRVRMRKRSLELRNASGKDA
jgi:cytochrome P450